MKEFEDYVDSFGVYQGPSEWKGNVVIEKPENLVSLGTLFKIKGGLNISKAPRLISLGGLAEVSGAMVCSYCVNLESLGALKRVFGYVDLRNCSRLKSLKPLQETGLWIYLQRTAVIDCSTLNPDVKVIRLSLGMEIPYTPWLTNFCWYMESIEGGTNSSMSSIVYRKLIAEIKEADLTRLPLMLIKMEEIYKPFIESRLKNG